MDNEASRYLESTLAESLEIKRMFLVENSDSLQKAAKSIADSVRKGNKLLICGNGGSAADAQHIAAEMVGRMLVERKPLPAIALTTDSSNLTAIGNDYGYEHVFSRQVQALARQGDVLLAISTSGKSPNVLAACREARALGCSVIGLTGGSGGELAGACDILLSARLGKNSSRIQETHLFALHSIVDLMDRFYLK